MTSKGGAVPSIPQANAPAKRMIVVDDDSAVRQMLVRVLTEAGHHVLSASSGRHALQLLATFDVDAALIDLGMPGEDGWSTLAAMRTVRPTLQAIIITARSHQQSAAKLAGAHACFEKPLDFPVLLTAVADAIAASRELRANGNTPAVAKGDPMPTPFPFSS
jgi:CheY-like chemotaxis protein